MGTKADDILNKKAGIKEHKAKIQAQEDFEDIVFKTKKANHNKKRRNIIITSIVIVLIAVIAGLIFCLTKYSFTGAAATVNGVDIPEQKVTDHVQKVREKQNLMDDKAWQQYLGSQGVQPSDIRNNVLDKFVQEEIINQIAKEKDFSVTNEDIEAEYAVVRAKYPTQEQWNQYLSSAGITDSEFKDSICQYLLAGKVQRQLMLEADINQDDINKMMMKYADKFNGSKGYYQIMFKKDDESKALEVLNNINSGKITFEQAAQETTMHDNIGSNFDYVMYDVMIQNPQTVSKAIADMHLGDVSGLIVSDDYIYIIKIVDEISCDAPLASLDKLPEQTKNNIKICMKYELAQDVYQKELKKYEEKYNIRIYDMPPFGIPYAKYYLS